MHFSTVDPAEPDLSSLEPQMAALRSRLADGAPPAEVIADWQALRGPVWSWMSWVNLKYRLDTRDEEVGAIKERRDALEATWEQAELALERDLLAVPPERADGVPTQAAARWTAAVSASNPKIRDERAQENALIAEYVKLRGTAEFAIDGTTHTLSTIPKLAEGPNRDLRYRAAKATWGWHAEHREQLDRIFDDLVHLRADIADKLGHRDFVETGYLRMARVDYGPDDVQRFRDAVRTHVVPLCNALRERQAAELGIDKVMLWDEPVLYANGNAEPVAVDQMLAAGREGFARLDPRIGAFYADLIDQGWIDLPARPGKAPGGFCTYLMAHRRPFVFCNATGTERDVRTLVHEVGHAFQKEASSGIQLPELLHATSDAAEIHSMGLEFLAWPVMDAWFGDDADKYRRAHLSRALLFLPYGLLVDEFQHRVYEAPDATPADRHGMNLELQASWLPSRDPGDLPHVGMGGFWQQQRHIYAYPFYYIDYCLAQTVALQFWALSQQDAGDAMERYVALCGRGGTRPFQALVRSTGLASPFDDGVVARVAETVAEALEL